MSLGFKLTCSKNIVLLASKTKIPFKWETLPLYSEGSPFTIIFHGNYRNLSHFTKKTLHFPEKITISEENNIWKEMRNFVIMTWSAPVVGLGVPSKWSSH
jgi:hypothetical protein